MTPSPTLSERSKTAQLTFQTERWSAFCPDAKELFRIHWESIALDRDKIELDMDFGRYQQLDDLGNLHILSVRDHGRVVGYFLFFLLTHMHYNSAGLMAITDVYFLLPEYRGPAGAKLLVEAERSLKERGVVKAYLSCKIHQDHSRLFEAMGWKATDKTFTKMLKG